MKARIFMRNLPRSGRSPWCRSAQDTRAAVRDFVGGASPEIRRLGSFAGYPQAAGYDPLLNNEPEFARTMAASVKQRIAFGERAGQKVRRISSGFGDEGERPELIGPRCANVNGFSLHTNTEMPAHWRDQLERLICTQ